MADTPNTPPTPPPATGVSPAVQQRFADMDMLVRTTINGQEQVLPLSVVAAGYQTTAAGRALLEEARTIRQQTQIDARDAERLRSIERELRNSQNPDERLQRIASAFGVPVGNAPDGSESTPESTQIRALQQRLSELESRNTSVAVSSQIDQVLDAYPFFRQDPEAREAVRTEMLAAATLGLPADMSDIANRRHTHYVRLAGAAATNQRDARETRTAAMPNVPAGLGTPELSDIQVGTADDLANRGEGLRQKMMQGLNRFRQSALGG